MPGVTEATVVTSRQTVQLLAEPGDSSPTSKCEPFGPRCSDAAHGFSLSRFLFANEWLQCADTCAVRIATETTTMTSVFFFFPVFFSRTRFFLSQPMSLLPCCSVRFRDFSWTRFVCRLSCGAPSSMLPLGVSGLCVLFQRVPEPRMVSGSSTDPCINVEDTNCRKNWYFEWVCASRDVNTWTKAWFVGLFETKLSPCASHSSTTPMARSLA